MNLGALRRRLLIQYLLTVGVLVGMAEVALYGLFRSSRQRELDAIVRKEIGELAAAVQLEPDRPEISAPWLLRRLRRMGQAGAWQVLVEDNGSLAQVLAPQGGEEELPALGGAEPALEELHIADAEYDPLGAVRAGRLRTVRQRRERSHRPRLKPDHMTFDIRVAVERGPVEAQLRSLAWYLTGGFPLVLGGAALGGLWLIGRAVRPVERAFERERRFTGMASHELRTPLTALRGEIDLALRRERTPSEYATRLGEMRELVGRMTGLVDGLLILARAEAGHLLIDAGEASVASLEKAVVDLTSLLPGRERLTLSRTAPPETRFTGDGLLLALAVRNLVENALVHAPAGPVQVHIDADSSGGLRLAVSDCGPGISDAVLARFDGKQTRPDRLVRDNGSASFGLAITRAVVEAHGGRLTLANRPEAGCLAEISLPAGALSRP
jgi:signal transduction histidine kinase